MHDSALESVRHFKNTYLSSNNNLKVLEVGSLSVNSNIKKIFDEFKYIGSDIVSGENVDIVIDDPYRYPFDDESFDVVLSISTFEHTEFFWLTYLEILRVLKDDGLFFLNAPSNSKYHRHETDNWRFYPDSIISLQKWGEYNNFEPQVLEHYTNIEKGRDIWNDYVSVTVKNKKFSNKYPNRIINSKKNFTNGRKNNSSEIINYKEFPQDQDNWGWKLYYKFRKFIHKFS